jgi:hypothetical protein
MSVASTLRPIRSGARATAAPRLPGRRLGIAARQLAQDLGAALASDLDEEAVLAVEDLGEREVVAGLRLRPGSHRHAEAGAAGSKQLTATMNASLRRAA